MYALHVDAHIRLALPMQRHAAAVYALIDAERDRFAEWFCDLPDSVEEQASRYRARRAVLAGGEVSFAFVVEVDGEVAGTIDLDLTPSNGCAEFAFLLASRFEGRGVVTRSLAAIVDAALAELPVRRFEIRCAPGNPRSRRVAARLGFRHEGTLREVAPVGTVLQDQEVHALLAREWRGTAG